MKELRLERGYNSYEQFAFEHDIGRAQYGKYERGTEDLRLSSLFKIINSFDLTFEDFFDPKAF
jgi:transcriptional regulator with XRE-family HTH domain